MSKWSQYENRQRFHLHADNEMSGLSRKRQWYDEKMEEKYGCENESSSPIKQWRGEETGVRKTGGKLDRIKERINTILREVN